jgi:peptidyl-prolyl cis-trans isomerase B (cyclophilin B)
MIVILLACLVLVGCGKDSATVDKQTTATSATNPPTATRTKQAPALPPRSTRDGCKAVAAPEPTTDSDRRRPRKRLKRTRRYAAVMETNCGTIRISLASGLAPKTTASFAALARNHFFDGLTFHRIAKPGGNDYVIQGGDPLDTGNGGPGYSVIEAPPRKTKYNRYVVAMAKTQTEQPGTSGSQFFIVTAKRTTLPPDYALLGRVVGGRKIVRRIAAVPTDPSTEMPIDPVVIESVRIRSSRR